MEQPDLAAATADVISASRNDRAMEHLTNRIDVEQGVRMIRWEHAR